MKGRIASKFSYHLIRRDIGSDVEECIHSFPKKPRVDTVCDILKKKCPVSIPYDEVSDMVRAKKSIWVVINPLTGWIFRLMKLYHTTE